MDSIANLISEYQLSEIIALKGYPQRNVFEFYDFKDNDAVDLRTFWIQELTKKSVLTLGYHMPSLSYGKKEIDYLVNTYTDVLSLMKNVIYNGNLADKLQCPTSKIFSIRQ